MSLLGLLLDLFFAPFDLLSRSSNSGEKFYERTYRSAPTAGVGDDGGGWEYWKDGDGNWGYEREVSRDPSTEEGEWSYDSRSGWYHKNE